MVPLTVKVKTLIGTNTAAERESSKKVFKAINAGLEMGRKVRLSLEGMTVVTAAFLNEAVGQLYFFYTQEFLRDHLELVDAMPDDHAKYYRVCANAIDYFRKQKEDQKWKIDGL